MNNRHGRGGNSLARKDYRPRVPEFCAGCCEVSNEAQKRGAALGIELRIIGNQAADAVLPTEFVSWPVEGQMPPCDSGCRGIGAR
jgi:hypothetical protein